MNEIYMTNEASGISMSEVELCMEQLLEQYPDLKKGPDYSPMTLPAAILMPGRITQVLYKKLSPAATVHVMPALGTHMAMARGGKRKDVRGCSA